MEVTLNKIALMATLATVSLTTPAPVMAIGIADTIETYLCTFAGESGTVTLYTHPDRGLSTFGDWWGAEITREDDRTMLKSGLEVLLIDGEQSWVVDRDGAVTGQCLDVSDVVRAGVEATFEATMEANPDLEVQTALQRAEEAQEATGAAELESVRLAAEVDRLRAEVARVPEQESLERRLAQLRADYDQMRTTTHERLQALNACRISLREVLPLLGTTMTEAAADAARARADDCLG